MRRKRRPLELSFDYIDTPERRVVSLVADGVACVPVLGFDAYRRQWRAAPIHVHDECLEISFCLRGDLAFELGGKRYPFRPGFVFVSRPDEPHRLGAYPKGMSKYWIARAKEMLTPREWRSICACGVTATDETLA